MKATLFWSILVFYVILLAAGMASDAVSPTFEARNDTIIFRGSLTIGRTLLNLSLLFMAIIAVIVLVTVNQKHEGTLSGGLVRRRLFVGLILMFLLSGSFFGSIYVLSKKVIVDEESIIYDSLLETKEVHWTEIEGMKGNFVPGSRLGLKGRNDHAWIEFITTSGGTVRLSLRFLRGISVLQTMVEERMRAI